MPLIRSTFAPGSYDACTFAPVPWDDFVASLASPVVSNDKAGHGGLSFARYRGGRRSLANFETSNTIGLDVDEGGIPLEWLHRALPFQHAVYPTASSTPAEPRSRAVVPLPREVTADEYGLVWTAFEAHLASVGCPLDTNARDASRFWYAPTVPAELASQFAVLVGHGDVINLDAMLARGKRLEAAREAELVEESTAWAARLTSRPASQMSALERASRYLTTVDPAIAGAGGHRQSFIAAQHLTIGFTLDDDDALGLLANDFNPRCEPPWALHELERKVRETHKSRLEPGYLLNAERAS